MNEGKLEAKGVLQINLFATVWPMLNHTQKKEKTISQKIHNLGIFQPFASLTKHLNHTLISHVDRLLHDTLYD